MYIFGLTSKYRRIDDITARQFPVFQETGISAGDLLVLFDNYWSQELSISLPSVHLAGAIGTANCPGAPSLKFYFGRPPPIAPAPDNTVPRPSGTVFLVQYCYYFSDQGYRQCNVNHWAIRWRWLHGTRNHCIARISHNCCCCAFSIFCVFLLSTLKVIIGCSWSGKLL